MTTGGAKCVMNHSNRSQPLYLIITCGIMVSHAMHVCGRYYDYLNVMCELLYGDLFAFIEDWPLPVAVKHVIKIPVVSTSIITTDTDSTIVSIAPSEEQLANALSALIVYNSWTDVVLLIWLQGSGKKTTVNVEIFAGLNIHGFSPMKFFMEIISQCIGHHCLLFTYIAKNSQENFHGTLKNHESLAQQIFLHLLYANTCD